MYKKHHIYANLLWAEVKGHGLADDADNPMYTRVSMWFWPAERESHKAILGSMYGVKTPLQT